MRSDTRFFIALLICTVVAGCTKSTSPTEPPSTTQPAPTTPFAFHKPRLGATLTMRAMIDTNDRVASDTNFLFTVTDTAATQFGKSGVLQFDGYYGHPFYISYRANGDIDILGNTDYIFSRRNTWVWYPLALSAGASTQTYTHDSLISNPDPNDTRQLEHDTVIVTGKETLTIQGQPVECIKAVLHSNYTLTNIQYGFTVGNTFVVEYWYAPSIGYWAKERYTDKSGHITFTLVDYTL
jgi:hypothetical protein